MDYPPWYRPSNVQTRATLYQCPKCGQSMKGQFYLRLSEPHPDLADFAFKKHNRKKIIDLRACRFCHLKQYKREQEARLRAKLRDEQRAAYEQAVAEGKEVTDERLIPRELHPPRPRTRYGYDPVLLYCKHVLKMSRHKQREVLRTTEKVLALHHAGKEGVQASVTRGNAALDSSPALTSLKYQYQLYRKRIEQALLIRERRHRDLQSLATATDPVRYNWSAYVTATEKGRLVQAARMANQHRVGIVLDPGKLASARVGARPFTWMPDLSYGMHHDEDRKLCALSWSDHLSRAKNSRNKAYRFIRYSFNRDPMQVRVRLFKPRSSGAPFTMVEFYRALGAAAEAAIELIEQAIGMGMTPTNYSLALDDSERTVVTHWEQLVPMHYEEIRDMRTAFDDETNNRIDPFSRLFIPNVLRSQHSDNPATKEEEAKQKRTRKQMKNGLDFTGLPIPIPAPAFEQ